MPEAGVIKPGDVIGMLGDGQLGKMLGQAASKLGLKLFSLGDHGRISPTGQAAWRAEAWEAGSVVPEKLLNEFCNTVKVALVEFENVPVGLVRAIEARGVSVRSGAHVLATAQDRIFEKDLATELRIKTPGYRSIRCVADVVGSKASATQDSILKTTRNGYDGKGQVRIKSGESIANAWVQLDKQPCILEDRIGFEYEISVIVARSSKEILCMGPFENAHENGILRTSTYPVRSSSADFIDLRSRACAAAQKLAVELGVHGLLAVEFFVTTEGELIFNEMAPRPHNSGHLTIECCETSQFEQYIRAACDWALGSHHMHSFGEMRNIIGDEVFAWPGALDASRTSLHLYGKSEAKPGRKMGHVVRSWHDPDRSCH